MQQGKRWIFMSRQPLNYEDPPQQICGKQHSVCYGKSDAIGLTMENTCITPGCYTTQKDAGRVSFITFQSQLKSKWYVVCFLSKALRATFPHAAGKVTCMMVWQPSLFPLCSRPWAAISHFCLPFTIFSFVMGGRSRFLIISRWYSLFQSRPLPVLMCQYCKINFVHHHVKNFCGFRLIVMPWA